jgi:hypothetical protein
MDGDCRRCALDGFIGQSEAVLQQDVGHSWRDAAGAVVVPLPEVRQQRKLARVDLPFLLDNENLELLAQFTRLP